MNDTKLLPEDPKFTAYALGELDAAETAEVEAALRADPALQAAVAAIRALAGQLSDVLAHEPLAAAITQEGTMRPTVKKKPGTLLKFPQLYFVIGSMAAACFAVVLALKNEELEKRDAEYARLLTTERAKRVELEAMEKSRHVSAAALPPEIAGATPPAPAPSPAAALITTGGTGNVSVVSTGAAPVFYGAGYPGGTIKYIDSKPVFGQNPSAAQINNSDKNLNRVVVDNNTELSKKAAMRIVGSWEDSGSARNFEFNKTTSITDNLAQQHFGGSSFGVVGNVLPNFTLRGYQVPALERYAAQQENAFLGVDQNPLSTFSIDVDTAGYANVRRFLNDGRRPPVDAVRIEELVNYFPYHYAPPVELPRAERTAHPEGTPPFAASMEVASAPWAPEHRLVRIGLKGREVTAAQRGAANLVFLLDVSGSMNQPNKLPLVKESLRLLVGKLRPDDHVAIVVYAGASGLALPSTPVEKSADILAAIDELRAGGSTNGAMGIQLAYDIAKANFVNDGINRVILCTDGDFNVGVTSEGDLTRLIEEKAKSKVFLTVLGFGMGNLKDATMETLADKGNGNYGYIDSRREAEKLLVEQVSGTLVTIAKDVKIQVEFNPAQVASYRLIGYENRMLKKEDFNNDKVDAGEIGAGHTVTALYEVVPVGMKSATDENADGATVDALKYRKPDTPNGMAEANPVSGISNPVSQELLTLKVRYKEPTGDVSKKLEFALTDSGAKFEQASADFQFAAAVAEFGMILRGSSHKGTGTLEQVATWAKAAMADDIGGYRGEFIGLVEKAAALQ